MKPGIENPQIEAMTPNRTLDLAELELPEVRRVLEQLDALISRETVSYLHPSKRWEYPWALERAALETGGAVLDAGCGASIFPIYLARQGQRVSAVDLEVPARLDRLHAVTVGYTGGGLTALPFQDESFDRVFCISVIEHLPRQSIPDAMRELKRVLRPRGRLLLTTDFYEDADAELWYRGPGEPFKVDWGFFDSKTLTRFILESPGFQLEGALDLRVDWEAVRPKMVAFHGYPYTSVGVTLVKI